MKIDSIAQNRFLYLISKMDRIALVCHKKPDCDTVGSMIALMLALKTDSQKTIDLFSSDAIPEQMTFLPRVEAVLPLSAFKERGYQLVVAFDCGDFSQTGFKKEGISRSSLPIVINIDHHGNEAFGDLNIINTKASSTAEVLYHLLVAGGHDITKDIATCLFAGIIQDTDNFKNPNTNIETFKTTSRLAELGVNMKKVGERLNFNRSMNSMKVWGKVLSRAKKHSGLNVVTTYVTNEDINSFSSCHEDVEGIANFLNSMPDVKAACVLMENSTGEIKGSLRTLSDDIDVSRLAQFFGGGGHRRAAGFSIEGRISSESGQITIE